jgi:lipopolysaccharide export system protein LptA
MQQFNSKYLLFIVCLFAAGKLSAQANDSTSLLEYIHADRYNFEKRDTANFLSLGGNVKLKKENTLFYCDSAVLNQKSNIVEAFGHVHINDADSVHTYADYMRYVGREKKAYLKSNVRLTDNKGVLTTNELEYEIQTKIGVYTKGGKIVNGKTVLTSTEATYFGDTRDIYFRKKVLLVDPEYRVITDTLLYNLETEVARFVTKTTIINKERRVTTSEGYYDQKNKKAVFGKRSIINDKDFDLTADNMAFDDKSGYGQAQGNAVYRTRDTANRTTVLADDIKFNRNLNSFLASMHPLMIIEQNRDSVFIAADTFYSGKMSELRKERHVPVLRDSVYLKSVAEAQKKDSGSNRFFEAYFHVRIFSDSMQAVSDSLFYSFEDSTFRLFKDPVVWSDNNQLTGDTIYLFTLKKKPERLYVFENALAVSHVANDYYNQVKGNSINGYFINGNIDNLRAKGAAQSIYFAQDDSSAFIGVNKSEADVIDMYFESRKPQRVVFRNNLKGTTYPIRQISSSELKLKGFKWLEQRRPKTWRELQKP